MDQRSETMDRSPQDPHLGDDDDDDQFSIETRTRYPKSASTPSSNEGDSTPTHKETRFSFSHLGLSLDLAPKHLNTHTQPPPRSPQRKGHPKVPKVHKALSPSQLDSYLKKDLAAPSSLAPSVAESSYYPPQPPYKWAYGDGVIVGRIRRRLYNRASKSFGMNPLHVAVLGEDLGIYGGITLTDYDGYRVPIQKHSEPARSARFPGLSSLAGLLLVLLLAVILGMATGFTFFRQTLVMDNHVKPLSSSKLLIAGSSGGPVTISGSVRFQLTVSNAGFLPLQLYWNSDTSESDMRDIDPFTDERNGGHALGLLVPHGVSNASLFQPIGFAHTIDDKVITVHRDTDAIITMELTARLSSDDTTNGFAAHMDRELAADSITGLQVECQGQKTCTKIMDLYIDQCQTGFVLMEIAVMQLIYTDMTGSITWRLFRTFPFPVPCGVS
eukprot:Blabericola_migrator_1__806@NODE_11_length_24785_cov_110_100736_g8_i0_p9_GENE_NODE_11_length_24785_cov_110_100736_g8_i0NODE_11_length_24785_cov_110_100736_g8_i0_p9_ORF_typecomplete_len441_score63_73PH_14/PF17787_1/0_012_NODE_11_length_24785_cov_110_100736_g8_i01159812920